MLRYLILFQCDQPPCKNTIDNDKRGNFIKRAKILLNPDHQVDEFDYSITYISVLIWLTV